MYIHAYRKRKKHADAYAYAHKYIYIHMSHPRGPPDCSLAEIVNPPSSACLCGSTYLVKYPSNLHHQT